MDWTLSFTDLSSTVLRDTDLTMRSSFFDTTLASADGIFLLYDITSLQSFESLTDSAYFYLWDCRSPSSGGGDSSSGHALKNPDRRRFGCVVVGNKADVVRAEPEKREVSAEMAEQWASSQGFGHVEVDSNERGEVEGAVETLVESIKIAWKRDAEEVEERKRMGERREGGAKGLPKKPRIGALGDKLKLALRTAKPDP
ncbi:hypothetical protein N0V83_009721 [Neocucurbitaria cava]|uniref:Uncharacterized protein n=1 Tax=Neocucurbitaria cava TaxID=798079 RepID=A0A9W8Y1X2_9PLEO|nr:hypothetical protein N0V83_009721 [Neocucurbitaria cava]